MWEIMKKISYDICMLLLGLSVVLPGQALAQEESPQECPLGWILIEKKVTRDNVTGENKVTIFCDCPPGTENRNGQCVDTGDRDIACVRQCGVNLKQRIDTCHARGASCSDKCDIPRDAALCLFAACGGPLYIAVVGGAAATPAVLFACGAACGVFGVSNLKCVYDNTKCKVSVGECHQRSLDLHKFCLETC